MMKLPLISTTMAFSTSLARQSRHTAVTTCSWYHRRSLFFVFLFFTWMTSQCTMTTTTTMTTAFVLVPTTVSISRNKLIPSSDGGSNAIYRPFSNNHKPIDQKYCRRQQQQQQQQQLFAVQLTSNFAPKNETNDSISTPTPTTSANTVALHSSMESSLVTNENEVHPSSLSSSSSCPKGVAILINANAGGVTSDMVEFVNELADAYNHNNNNNHGDKKNNNVQVYVTYTLEQAEQAIYDIVKQNPALVIPMGGDGTLTTCIESLQVAYNAKKTRPKKLPIFGYVAMGTGNALATVIGCRPAETTNSSSSSKRQRIKKTMSRLFRRKHSKRQQIMETLHQLLELESSISSSATSASSNDGSTATTTAATTTNSILANSMDIVEMPLMQVTAHRHDGDESPSTQRQQRHYCFFAGVGFDSMMLQDYQDLQEWAKNNQFWKNKLKSVFGYCVTLVTRTLPKCIGIVGGGSATNKKKKQQQLQKDTAQDEKQNYPRPPYLVDIQVTTNQPSNTVWIDHRRGDVVRRVVETENDPLPNSKSDDNNDDKNNQGTATPTPVVLYQGIAGIVAASTTPFYGGNMKLFPFARMSLDKMQLRIGRIHPFQGVMNLPGIFQGSYRDFQSNTFGCLDFLSTQLTIEILNTNDHHDDDDDHDEHDGTIQTNTEPPNETIMQQQQPQKQPKGYPVQHSGESIGHCHKIDLEVVPDPVRFVTLLPPRLVYEKNIAE